MDEPGESLAKVIPPFKHWILPSGSVLASKMLLAFDNGSRSPGTSLIDNFEKENLPKEFVVWKKPDS